MKWDLLGLIFSNFWYKVGAVLLALIIWGIVQGEEILEVNRRIRVNISVASGYMVKDKPFRYLDAELRGPRVLLSETFSEPIEAKVYVPSGQTGYVEMPFDKKYIKGGWDDRIKLIIRDPYINFVVDEKITRDVVVREVLRGAPADEFFIQKITIKPDTVSVTGPKSSVTKLQEIATQPIDVTGLNQSKTLEIGVVTEGIDVESISADLVKVSIQIGDSKVNKSFTGIPLEIVGSQYETTLKPKYVSIVIQGTPGILKFVNKTDLRAFAELTDVGPGKYEKEVQVKIPPDTVLIETFPEKVAIIVHERKRVN